MIVKTPKPSGQLPTCNLQALVAVSHAAAQTLTISSFQIVSKLTKMLAVGTIAVLAISSLAMFLAPVRVSGCHYTMIIIQNETKLNTTGWSRNSIFGEP